MEKVVQMIDCGLCVELFCSVNSGVFYDFFDNLPFGSYVLSTARVSDDCCSVRVYCSSEYVSELEKYFVERGVIYGKA